MEFALKEGLIQMDSSSMKKMEGQLSKFTNLVKGWQYRWFVLDPEAGMLSYYLDKDQTKNRGCLLLTNAVISPSDEDSMTFMVSACNGDVYKLRGADAKERQHWINLIRAVAEFHGKNSINPVPRPPSPVVDKIMNTLRRSGTLPTISPTHAPKDKNTNTLMKSASVSYQFPRGKHAINPIEEELKNIRDALNSVSEFHSSTVEALESAPDNTDTDLPSALDEQVLLLKATSQATVNILERCYKILQTQSMEVQGSAQSNDLPPGSKIEWFEPRSSARFKGSPLTGSEESVDSAVEVMSPIEANFMCIDQYSEEELEDREVQEDSQLEDMETHKSVILHLLSQMKLGMDLTRVVLPTFALETRSLLEMYADFLGHADLFVRIPDCETPEERMLAVLVFYLTSFHVGRKSGVAKKPYNPILGERFHCSMLPKSDATIREQCTTNGHGEEANGEQLSQEVPSSPSSRIYFVAEQVSHHPPISAFYAECPSKKISMNSHIWTKSKFYGMSIGVINVGEGIISLPDRNEDYIFTFPNAYCRSILTVPWIELGGKTCIQCCQTGYSATITFHTKPFYGGKPNRITCEMKRPGANGDSGEIICHGEGTWDGLIELNFTNSAVEKKIIDVSSLEVTPKHVRPLDMQAENESRKLWRLVTESLLASDLELATAEKHKLEEKQRSEAKERLANGSEWKPRLFQKHSDSWIFNSGYATVLRRKKKSHCDNLLSGDVSVA